MPSHLGVSLLRVRFLSNFSQGRSTSSTYFVGTPPWFDSDRIGVDCPRVEVEVSDIVSLACELLMFKSFSVVDDPTVLDIARKLEKDPEQ